jgi:PKHD-type hydroxylase
LTLLLNTPGVDFEGGELQFGGEPGYEIADVKKGDIILFPSFELHQVSPVTQGLRKSIVAWVLGPKWK